MMVERHGFPEMEDGRSSPPGSVRGDLVVRAINYHGQKLASFLKDEPIFRDLDFRSIDYHLFSQRSVRDFRVDSDRSCLFRFISGKLPHLFGRRELGGQKRSPPGPGPRNQEFLRSAILPPLESLAFPGEFTKENRLVHFFDTSLATCDVVYCRVTALNVSGLLLTVSCMASLNLDNHVQDYCQTKSR